MSHDAIPSRAAKNQRHVPNAHHETICSEWMEACSDDECRCALIREAQDRLRRRLIRGLAALPSETKDMVGMTTVGAGHWVGRAEAIEMVRNTDA